MLRFCWVATGLAIALSGCPASHSPENDPVAFWARVQELSCAQIAPCAAPPRVNAWIAAAPEIDCFDVWSFDPGDTIDPSRVRFDPALAADCLARVATSCDGDLAAMCPGVLTGLSPPGAPCRVDAECVDGAWCSFDDDVEACDGRCTVRPTSGPCVPGCGACTVVPGEDSRCLPRGPLVELASGERCDDPTVRGVCPAMHYCVETCRPFPGEGEPCGDYWPICAPGLGCGGGLCQPTRVVALGEACDEELIFCDRFHGAECADGMCVPMTRCEPAWRDIDCPVGTWCGDAGVCLRRVPLGEPCVMYRDTCSDGGRCIDEVCLAGC